MSMYNMLHGVNPNTPVLLSILGIDQPEGKWSSGRFRDIELNGDGTKILLFTRNGGGNREHHSYDDSLNEAGENCMCTGCIGTYHLPKHPNYLTDYDDSFDCTYAYFEFSVPEKWQEFTKSIASGIEPKKFAEKFQEKMLELEGMSKEQFETSPQTKHIAEAFKPIFEQLK